MDNNWIQIGDRLCGRQIPPVFNSTETKLKVRIRTDSDIQGDGFKVSIEMSYFFSNNVRYIVNIFLSRLLGLVFAISFLHRNPE